MKPDEYSTARPLLKRWSNRNETLKRVHQNNIDRQRAEPKTYHRAQTHS